MRRIGVISGIMLLLFLLCLIWPLSGWFKAFIKIDQMRVPYLASFFVLLLLALVALQRYLLKSSTFVSLLIGAGIGYVAAMLSISIVNLLIPNGLDRTLRSVQHFGIQNVVLTDLVVAFVLGGWLFGMVGAVVSRTLLRREDAQAMVR